jgi:hypothetical protein
MLGLVLATVQADDLWMQDRNFCTRAFLCEIDRRGAGFITRQHEGLPFERVNALRSVGRIETGHVAEQRVQVWDEQGGSHLFRRIRVKLDEATRDGDRVLYMGYSYNRCKKSRFHCNVKSMVYRDIQSISPIKSMAFCDYRAIPPFVPCPSLDDIAGIRRFR